jgi:hypothetical protein
MVLSPTVSSLKRNIFVVWQQQCSELENADCSNLWRSRRLSTLIMMHSGDIPLLSSVNRHSLCLFIPSATGLSVVVRDHRSLPPSLIPEDGSEWHLSRSRLFRELFRRLNVLNRHVIHSLCACLLLLRACVFSRTSATDAIADTYA